jgi:hypothetical protein
MTKPKYLDLGGVDQPTLIGQSALLRGTDAGECSVCHMLSATLVNGKCPKHADVTPAADDTKLPDLLGGGAAKKDKGGCWTKRS